MLLSRHNLRPLTLPLQFRTKSSPKTRLANLNLSKGNTLGMSDDSQTRAFPFRANEKSRDDGTPSSTPQSTNDAYGFIVYRTDYTSNEKWQKFMSYLNAQARSGLISSGNADLLDRLDWDIQESAELDGADTEKVRQHFQTWLSTHDLQNNHPRFCVCILVDELCINAVETALEDGTPEDDFDNQGYTLVYLVSKKEDEGYQAVGVSYLLPRVYEVLAEEGWEGIKQRYEEDVAMP